MLRCASCIVVLAGCVAAASAKSPRFTPMQPELFAADGKLLGTRLVATGDGYGSQSIVPVQLGLAERAEVTVEVTFLTREGRRRKRVEGVDPRKWAGKTLVVKADD